MLGEDSSERESNDKKTDTESDYEPSESESSHDDDDNKGNLTMITRSRSRRRRNSSKSEAIKTRGRKGNRIYSSVLDFSWNTRKRDTVRIPAQRFKSLIFRSSSSVNVDGGTITTRSKIQDSIFESNNETPNAVLSRSPSSRVEIQETNITRSSSSQPLILSAQRFKGPTFRSSSSVNVDGGTITLRSKIQDSIFESNNETPNSVLSRSPSSRVEIQETNITRSSNSCQPLILSVAGFNLYDLREQPSLLQNMRGFDLNYPYNDDDEGFDLNYPYNDEDEGFDLNLPPK